MGTVVDGNYYSKYSGDQIDFLLAQNRNWIRNGYFVGGGTAGKFPINQRGLTSYTSEGGTIDGWDMVQNYALEVNSDNIYVHPNGGALKNVGISQVIENGTYLAGKTVTFSAVISGGGGALLYGQNSLLLASIGIAGVSPTEKTLVKRTVYVPDYVTQLTVSVSVGMIHAIKLEEGTACTLTTDLIAPDYGEELAKCQRYLQVIKTDNPDGALLGSGYVNSGVSNRQILVSVPLPVPMNPIQTFTPVGVGSIVNGALQSLESGSVFAQAGNIVTLALMSNADITAPFAPATAYVLYGGYVLLSAE